MKKNLLLFLLLFSVTVAMGQANRNDVRKLLDLDGTVQKYTNLVSRFGKQLPSDRRKEFMADANRIVQQFVEVQVKNYAAEFSQNEVLKLVDFYQSPLGKKYVQKNIEANSNRHAELQNFEIEIQGLAMKYMM